MPVSHVVTTPFFNNELSLFPLRYQNNWVHTVPCVSSSLTGALYMILHLFIYLFFYFALTWGLYTRQYTLSWAQYCVFYFSVCVFSSPSDTVCVYECVCERERMTWVIFSVVRSLQCGRRKMRWQNFFRPDLSNKNPRGVFVLLLPDVGSVVFWNPFFLFYFRKTYFDVWPSSNKVKKYRSACWACLIVSLESVVLVLINSPIDPS